MDVFAALAGLIWLGMGVYFLAAAPALHARPRLGTALRPSTRGYRLLGAVFLALAAMQLVVLLTG